METLRAENISKRFGALEVIKNISIAFEPGTVTAIVGDNGAGKSTFLKILAGVHAPNSGKVFLGAENLPGFSPLLHRSAGIEMVYQDLALAKNHDVITNLFIGREITSCYCMLNRKAMGVSAKTIFQELNVSIPSLSSKVGNFSGGQQQAVAIARALLFNPKVLLLDEPTAALAAREVGRVIDLIRQQKAQGRTVILVSHRLNDVFAVSDRIVVLKHGQLFSDDPVSAVNLSEVVQRIVS
jgi:ABC-type sugar transport system ATPase subunit